MLPCTNCGNILDITKGTIVQCFACGTKNSHFESYDLLSAFVLEVFGYNKAIETIEPEISENTINTRVKTIDEKYSSILQEIEKNETFVYSKISIIDTKQLLPIVIDLSKKISMLKLLIELYILPHIKGKVSENKYLEYSATCEIYHLAVLGLRNSIEGKDNFKPENSTDCYEKARWNFINAYKSAEKFINQGFNFRNEMLLFQICSEYCTILKEVINANPSYYSEQFEQLLGKLDELTIAKARNLRLEIQKILNLANSLPKIMEEIRLMNPIKSIEPNRERILFHTEEIIEDVINVKIWIQDIEERYKNLQSTIIQLHCGQFIAYLRDFRNEFQNRMKTCIETHNNLIEKISQTALLDYTLSISDILEEMESGFTLLQITPVDIIEKTRYLKKDIISLDSDLKQFLFEILDYGIPESLRKNHISEIVSSISDKHSAYDRLIYQYVKKLIDKFIEERDEKGYTIEEQRDKFNLEFRPLLDNLIRESFTITEDQIPYPIFIELVMLTTQLEVDKEYKVFFIIENPAKLSIDDVNVSFFVPNTFKIRTRQYKIGKMKPGDKLNVETRIVPDQAGFFYFMAMLQYEFSKEMFWMPSVKLKLKVVDTKDLSITLNEDEFLNEIYKKYGQISNKEQNESIEVDNRTVESEKKGEIKEGIEQIQKEIDNEDSESSTESELDSEEESNEKDESDLDQNGKNNKNNKDRLYPDI